MARTIANGPPGLEVPHKINGVYGDIVMNVPSARPRIRLTGIKGFYSLPDADDNREPHVGRRGESTYPGAARGKTVVYTGELQARTLEGLRILTNTFKKAITERSSDLEIQVQDPEIPWFYHARVIDCEIDEEQRNGPTMVWPWTRTFQLSLRLDDGRIYVDDGGASYSGEDGEQVTVTNEGSTDTDPVMEVISPGGVDIGIENVTTGKALVLTKPGTGTIIFNFGTREITCSNEDFTEFLDEESSNWWDENVIGIAPGASALVGTGGKWNVSFFHASE